MCVIQHYKQSIIIYKTRYHR